MQIYVLCTLAVVAVVLARPQGPEPEAQPPAQILKHEAIVNPDGYQFEFETSDGTQRQEVGQLKQIDEEHKALTVTGSYRYVAPNGVIYTVTYTADEHGYQPQERIEAPQN